MTMAPKVLQINFTFSVSPAELRQAWLAVAHPIADTPGLRWKIWLMNEVKREAGGVYLFDDADAMQAFLDGPIAAALKNDPALSSLSASQFDVMEDYTAITRGPVRGGARI
jgi:hypothetical protein